MLARRGQGTEAERLARGAVDRAWRTEYIQLRTLSLEALAEVLHLSGRTAEASEALERAIAAHDAKGSTVAAAADRRALAELQAATAAPD